MTRKGIVQSYVVEDENGAFFQQRKNWANLYIIKFYPIKYQTEAVLFCTNDKPPQRGLPYTGEGRNGLSIPRGSHPREILFRTTLLIFYPCCPMRGHMWTALLNPTDRPPYPFYFLSDISSSSLLPPQTSSLLIPLTADSYLYASPYQR